MMIEIYGDVTNKVYAYVVGATPVPIKKELIIVNYNSIDLMIPKENEIYVRGIKITTDSKEFERVKGIINAEERNQKIDKLLND